MLHDRRFANKLRGFLRLVVCALFVFLFFPMFFLVCFSGFPTNICSLWKAPLLTGTMTGRVPPPTSNTHTKVNKNSLSADARILLLYWTICLIIWLISELINRAASMALTAQVCSSVSRSAVSFALCVFIPLNLRLVWSLSALTQEKHSSRWFAKSCSWRTTTCFTACVIRGFFADKFVVLWPLQWKAS